MKTLTGDTLKTIFKEYFLMAIGMFIYGFGWIACLVPAKCAGGGAAGFGTIIYYASGQHMPIAVTALILNGVLLLVAGFIVGWNFGIKTIYCTILISVTLGIWQGILPSDTDIFKLDNRLLSSILGGIIAGIGVAMSFRQGGSTGGTDIVAMIVNKYRTISYSRVVIICDFTIISSALFVGGLGIDSVIYGFVMTAVFGYTVDMIMSGNQQSSQILIVTQDYEQMADFILENAHRGVTLLDSTGWYSKEKSKTIMVVCRKRETSTILKLVKRVDPDAFITVGSVMGVYGKGFEALNKI